MGLFEPQEYSEKVSKIIQMDENTPARKMLLKGALPVLSPGEVVAALAYLAHAGDERALQTLGSLPENMYERALSDEALPGQVVTYLFENLDLSKEIVTRILKDPRLDDRALEKYARTCPEDMAQIIADNQERLLRAPGIIESLYMNQNTPMSTAMRILELAVRAGLELKISAYEEMKRSLESGEPEPEDELEAELQKAALDQQFRLAQKESDEEEDKEEDKERKNKEERIPIHMLPVPVKIRLAIMGSKFQRSQLVKDSNKVVAMAAIKSPAITEQEVEEISKSRQVADDVIRYIARRRDWLKNYKIKVNLVMNPKTPIPTSISLLTQIRKHDLKMIARSHNVPAAVREAAQKRLKHK